MKLVILESPYAGDIAANVDYARRCVSACLHLGESAIASHLLYTQPLILRDEVPEERALGIAASLAWSRVCDYHVFYTDRGWSRGMIAAVTLCCEKGKDFRVRSLTGGPPTAPPIDGDDTARHLFIKSKFEGAPF